MESEYFSSEMRQLLVVLGVSARHSPQKDGFSVALWI